MTNSPTTDERLRTLPLSQSDTERLAADILRLSFHYTQVKPRQPMGGPDQGRDIEAVYHEQITVWGAVGFQKMVGDTSDQKRNAKKKFKDDLKNAKKNNPDLQGFVFFTNVDLTGAERTELETYASKEGVRHVDIFWRERI